MLQMKRPGPDVVELIGSLSIHTVEQLYQELQELKELTVPENESEPITFKMEQVSDVDLSGLQTLLAYKMGRPKDTVRFSMPEEIQRLCRLCGLDKYLS